MKDKMKGQEPMEGQEPMQTDDDFIQELAGSVPPEQAQKIQTAMGAITQMVYDPRTKAKVQQMLKRGDPMQTLPMTANAVFENFETMSGAKSGKMPLDAKLVLGIHTFTEVKDLGTAMGLLPEMDVEQAQPLMKETMQLYIRKGLKDKSIDPIELQEQVEPLMSPDERQYGMESGQQLGMPEGMTQQQGMQGMMERKMQPMQVEQQRLMKENAGMKSALQGIAEKGA